MKIKKGFILRKVGGECVVVPVGEMSKQFHGMINLNETGSFLWNFFTAEHTEEEAIAALLNEYEVDEETARRSVAAFVEKLDANGFLA